MNKTIKQTERYEAPTMNEVFISVKRCLAVSITGGNESLDQSQEESQNEGFGTVWGEW